MISPKYCMLYSTTRAIKTRGVPRHGAIEKIVRVEFVCFVIVCHHSVILYILFHHNSFQYFFGCHVGMAHFVVFPASTPGALSNSRQTCGLRHGTSHLARSRARFDVDSSATKMDHAMASVSFRRRAPVAARAAMRACSATPVSPRYRHAILAPCDEFR
jgi:hypothetical protein